jgi:hypothetical protein
MQATATTKKTIQGVTYYQDPADSDLWYDDPTHVGSGRTAFDISELDDMISRRRYYIRELHKADRATYDGECQADEGRAEIADMTAQIKVLEALAA